MKATKAIDKYTKRQRLAIYKIALNLLERDMKDECRSIGGFCYYISNGVGEYINPKNDLPYIDFEDSADNKIQYPEIFVYKPKCYYNSAFWFSTNKSRGGAKRVEILKAVIADMEKK